MKAKRIPVMLAVTLLFFSCAHQTPFMTKSPKRVLRQGTLAIIPGNNSSSEMIIIEYLNRSAEMREIGPMKLIPFDDYKEKIKREWITTSPYTIKSNNKFEADFSQVDRRSIDIVFNELGTDYVYVLWVPHGSSHLEITYGKYGKRRMYYDLRVFGMLFSKEDPEHELGVTDYEYSEKQPESCCFLFPAPAWGEELDSVMKPKLDAKARELAAGIRKEMIRALTP